MKDLHTENYETLMKETEEAQINGKTTHVHGLEELILLKCLFYTKPSIDSIQSLSRFPRHFSQK